MARLRLPTLEHALSKAALALDVFLWLSLLPLLLRIHSVPALLERLANKKTQSTYSDLDAQQAIRIVAAVCNLHLFRSRVFPKRCLRQSLALYRTLLRLGHSPRIHFGVRKDGHVLIGHSWVSIDGTAIADTSGARFETIYSHRSLEHTLKAHART